MSELALSDLLEVVLREIARSLEQTGETGGRLQLYVSDVDLDLPAAKLPAELPRLVITLPAALEAPPVGRLGRVRVVIGAGPPAQRGNPP